MNIRRATIDDANAIGHIQVESIKIGYKGIVPNSIFENLNANEQGEKYAQKSSLDDHIVLVAEENNTLTGFCCIGPARVNQNEFSHEVYAVYIDPKNFGKGIGGKLLRSALGICKQNNWNNIILWCFAENTSANKCYEKAGGEVRFETSGKPHDSYIDVPHRAYCWHL